MSAANFELSAELRNDLGKSASRRLRREEKVLGVVYGGDEAPASIVLAGNKVRKALENDAVYSHILNLTINGKKQQVVLKDLQRHPYKPVVLHMDFLRVKATDMITMRIPLHYQGEDACIGVENGGIINHHMMDVEIRCQAGKLPEHFDVDVSKLDVDAAIHLSALKLPAGAEIVLLAHGHDEPMVSVHLPRQSKLDEEEAKEDAAAAVAAAEASAAEAAENAEALKAEVKTAPAAEHKPEGKSDKK